MSHFPNAIRKYGKDEFSHQVLQEGIHTLEQANIAEKFAIELLCTRDPEFGFNLKPGGLGIPHLRKIHGTIQNTVLR